MAGTPTETTPPPTIKVPHVDSGVFIHELHLLTPLWPLAVIIALGGAGRLGLTLRRQLRLRRAGMNEIDRMDGATFELKLASLFRDRGCPVELVGRRGDFGADLLVSLDGRRTAVQAKRWSKNVGINAVNEVVGARGYYGAERAMVVTNSHFTSAARTQAAKNGVVLWDRKQLTNALLKGSVSAMVTVESEGLAQTDPLTQTDGVAPQTPAHCALCGKPVSEKVRAFCRAYPQRFAGLVYCFEHQRTVS